MFLEVKKPQFRKVIFTLHIWVGLMDNNTYAKYEGFALAIALKKSIENSLWILEWKKGTFFNFSTMHLLPMTDIY